MLGKRLRALREDKNQTQKDLAEYLGLTPKMISFYELEQRTPPADIILKLANLYHVTTDYLLGNEPPATQPPLPQLTAKDERQIADDLENMLNSLDGAAAMGDDSDDEEDRELLKTSLLQAMTLSKRLAKKKFTPKKYR
ncbi:helix-turn-helix transcriptional regulator [uncultured Mitsuokella sp.]|uniref:helix-turn-helix domain-containing protein n=1 Tax=uncultured Mitsuokella sp. TaxID=453120 RepID=UPI002639EDAB|nr:helix-turn-helix transcriptional regulator [uncultured Mitsuokella sp.]